MGLRRKEENKNRRGENNIMNYTRDELFSIAKRYNNSKRTYLIVNKKQAKYLPSKPSETFAMTNALAQKMWQSGVKDENTLVIGFAETATALGRLIADHFSQAFYLTTTREEIIGKCIEFKEEHSYVVEQRIAIEALSKAHSFSQVVFVDDEFTTGRTLRNLAQALLKEVPSLKNSKKFAVTVIDRTNEENKAKLKELGIEIISLLSFTDDNFEEQVKNIEIIEPKKVTEDPKEILEVERIGNIPNARLGYTCGGINTLAQNLLERYKNQIQQANNILVLGTEEFMAVPIYFAREIEKFGKSIVCHATARSPIGVLKGDREESRVSSDHVNALVQGTTITEYPIQEGYKLVSFYQKDRSTYLYSMHHYDLVFVLTDSKEIPKGAIKALNNLMCIYKNYNTKLIQFTD